MSLFLQGPLFCRAPHPLFGRVIFKKSAKGPKLKPRVSTSVEEEWGWLGEKMRYYRRPLRDLIEPLTAAGFVIERSASQPPAKR
jgi:hypothetical protein